MYPKGNAMHVYKKDKLKFAKLLMASMKIGFDGRTHRQWYPIVNNISIISSSLSMLSHLIKLKIKSIFGHRISRLEMNFTKLLL